MAPRGPERGPDAAAVANVAASVRVAIEALSHLHASLERGGFAEGAPAYERMAEVLVTQRMWAQQMTAETEAAALDEEFAALGDVARRVFALLEPYTTAVRRLAVLAPSDQDVARRRLLEALDRRGGRGASLATLARELRSDRAALEPLLAALVEEGAVTARGSGGAALYALAAPRRGRPSRSTAATGNGRVTP